MIFQMKDLSQRTIDNISICKSSSNVSGYKLRHAHYYLGSVLAQEMEARLDNSRLTVLCMMRSGLCFSLGISDQLEKAGNHVDLKFLNDNKKMPEISKNDTVIIVDGVINSGNSMLEVIDYLNDYTLIVATNVLSSKSVSLFSDINVFTTRISKHHYKGENTVKIKDGKGPDTSERLFNSGFYK